MLVLTRRIQEKVVLPGLGVTIQVLAIKGGVVRIGIEAPMDVPIFRAELLNRSEPSPTPVEPDVAPEGSRISMPASDR
jgi:carbon storage regulator CsrA